jgi:hypothetical protein
MIGNSSHALNDVPRFSIETLTYLQWFPTLKSQ